MARRRKDLDIHEQILVYLHEEKKSPVDIMAKFKDVPKGTIYDAASYLQRNGLIKARYPFIGTHFYNDDLGETGFIPVENPEFVKAALTVSGGDQARFILRTYKPKSGWRKFFEIVGAIVGVAGSIVGIIEFIRWIVG